MFSLAGKRALITGAARGIGRALAFAMGEAGAEIIVSGRKQAALDECAAALRAAAPSSWTCRLPH
jgi:NAD(P)-dependent dehydrogenase (short-subunit alcohol dehydrogenase family)